MSIDVPQYLQDMPKLLCDTGIQVGNKWYHGSASGLSDSINDVGLKRSGDAQYNQSIKQTMATIGNSYTESIEPIFLTQSKELAFYWANNKARLRSQRIGQEETPVVYEVSLPDDKLDWVLPDAGGAGLIIARDQYLEFLRTLYKNSGLELEALDPRSLTGIQCLNLLGLAYCDHDIDPDYLTLLNG